MKEMISKILAEASRFSQMHNLPFKQTFNTVEKLRNKSNGQDIAWASFEKSPGVYCILSENENKIIYIGMSQICTGGRLFDWIFDKNKTKEERMLKDSDIILNFVIEDYPYMSPALESYLLSKFETKVNSRR